MCNITARSYTHRNRQKEDANQCIVNTPYGRGLVIRTRPEDDVKEVEMLEWDQFAKKPQQKMMYTSINYPSVQCKVGDDVVCEYGRGRVTDISKVDDSKSALKYTIELASSSWMISGRKPVVCNTCDPPRVVRKHTPLEMNPHEKITHSKSYKTKATKYFTEKDYNQALSTYAEAVNVVRNVQHDHTSTNEVRADLVVIMITCSNNAATCCIKLGKWSEAKKFAQNALILADALYNKKGKKIHTLLNKEGTIDAKLFGEWRVKSYLITARAYFEEGNVKEAITLLKTKAKVMAMQYIDEINTEQLQNHSKEEKASLKSLTNQVKEIKRLLVECSNKKKATKSMEKKRAKAMFGGKDKVASTLQDNKPSHQKENNIETDMPLNNKKSTLPAEGEMPNEDTSRPVLNKAVSFSKIPPEVKEYEKEVEYEELDKEDSPAAWYDEHKEALVLVAVAGLSAVSVIALKRFIR